MPDKPVWLDRLPEAIRRLKESTDAWVDRSTIEFVLAVGRRRAQQLLAPIAKRRIGTSVIAERAAVIEHLRRVAAGEEAYYEDRRRKQLWARLAETRRQWLEQPPVLVEVPEEQIRQVRMRDFDGLPDGVELQPGSIAVHFRSPEEALQKLIALALAISHNREAFEERVTIQKGGKSGRLDV